MDQARTRQFLENSTGRFLHEAIVAMRTIGAEAAALSLSRIESILCRGGVLPEALRTDLNALALYSVSTFSEAHPGVGDDVVSAIQAEPMSLHVVTVERLLERYVESHFDELRVAVARYAGA